MTIKLGDGWTLDSDERQWILGQEIGSKGEELSRIKTVGYYRDLDSVANAIGRKTAQRAVAGKAFSLDDVVNVLGSACETISRTLKAAHLDQALQKQAAGLDWTIGEVKRIMERSESHILGGPPR